MSRQENQQNMLRHIRSDLYVGLTFLSKIPLERLFQLFVDGVLHCKEHGQQGFEEREPGCMRGFYNGMCVAIENIHHPVSIDLILTIHRVATMGVTGEYGLDTNSVGDFRNYSMAPLRVSKKQYTILRCNGDA